MTQGEKDEKTKRVKRQRKDSEQNIGSKNADTTGDRYGTGQRQKQTKTTQDTNMHAIQKTWQMIMTEAITEAAYKHMVKTTPRNEMPYTRDR